MRYVIVGGAGFVGYHLIEELLHTENEIAVIDIKPTERLEVEHYLIDIRDKKSLLDFSFRHDDIVVHLAATQYHERVPRQGRKEYFFDINCKGTENLLEAMAEQQCRRLIFFSTDMTYGKPQYLPVDTQHQQVPFGPYGASKKEAERLCHEFRKKGFQITIFRPRMILGPGRLGVLVKLFKLMDYGLPIPLIGNGTNCYQMVSVRDCVDAVIRAVDKKIPNGEYNLGSANPPTVYQLLHDLIQRTGSKSFLLRTNGKLVKSALAFLGALRIELLYKEQYEIADENYIVDIQHTEDDLCWVPKDSDEDMLLSAYEYYKNMR